MNSALNGSTDNKIDSIKSGLQSQTTTNQQKLSSQQSHSSQAVSSTFMSTNNPQSTNNQQSMSQNSNPQQQNVPLPKKASEMSALDRLKHIQSNYKQHWKGINCEYSGRPGTSNFVNRKRVYTISEGSIQEDERQKQLGKCFQKLKEFDDESRGVNSFAGSTNITNRTATSQLSGGPSGIFNSSNKESKQGEYITFKNITEKQLVTNTLQFNGYSKNFHIENSELLYKMLRFDNKLIRSLLENGGFAPTESHEWNILWGSSSCKSYLYEGLNEFQKINHFPQSHEITRKDRLCFNIVRMQERYGKQHFDFSPDTYILPDEFGEFYEHYQKLKQHDSKKNIWIVKPANAAQGRGISIVDDINDVNVDELSVISRYVTNPLLINGHKFDLRIYVLITSYEPLRIYVFQEGLARFASETYTSKINKNNKFMHLTNYSINKKNDKFIMNENCEQDDYGYKWSLGAFCRHLEQVGIDMNLLWSRTYDVIIKTILSAENYVQNAMKKNGTHRTNCFEILGFDILVDSDLKPWLLEVNLSPSLACDSPLDLSIKSNLVCDAFNLAGVKRFDRKKESLNKIKHRMNGLYNKGKKPGTFGPSIQGTGISPAGMAQTNGNDIYGGQSSHQLIQMIDHFCTENPVEYSQFQEPLKRAANIKYKEYVRETILENNRKGNFIRIYPSRGSEIYDPFFQHQRPYNKVLQKVLFSDEILKNFGKLANISNQMNIQNLPPSSEKQLGYDMQLPPNSYEQYKKINQERQSSTNSQSNNTQSQGLSKALPQRQIQSASNKDRESTMGGAQSVSSGIQNALDKQQFQKTPQANRQSTGNEQKNQIRPQTSNNSASGISNKMGIQDNGKTIQQEKVLITGDDILIEYVDRLMNQLKQMNDEGLLQEGWRKSIEKFITHYVWHSQDRKKGEGELTGIIERLEGRLHEMQERRRRLIKYLYKKEGKLEEFEEGFYQSINKKSTIIKKFSSIQLEDLLRTSTKNVAQEVVSSLIPPQGGLGVLSQVEKYCHNMQQYQSASQLNRNLENQPINAQPQKQRIKSASMNKRMIRGISREDDQQFDENNSQGPQNPQQYHGYTGHLSNPQQFPREPNRQSKTSSGARPY